MLILAEVSRSKTSAWSSLGGCFADLSDQPVLPRRLAIQSAIPDASPGCAKMDVSEGESSLSITAQQNEPHPAVAMLQVIQGFWVSRAIYAVAKLGIADMLNEGPRTIEELAA